MASNIASGGTDEVQALCRARRRVHAAKRGPFAEVSDGSGGTRICLL